MNKHYQIQFENASWKSDWSINRRQFQLIKRQWLHIKMAAVEPVLANEAPMDAHKDEPILADKAPMSALKDELILADDDDGCYKIRRIPNT